MWRPVIAIAVALFLAPLTGQAEDSPMMGPGMMGMGPMGGGMGMGYGMGPGMMGMGPYHMLNLSDDQRGKVNKIQDEERRKHWEIMGKVMDERAKLRDLFDADKRDTQAILKVQDQIDQLQRKMLELHLNTRNQIEAVLTPEQRDQLKNLRRGGCGMGPGMGGGRHGMMR